MTNDEGMTKSEIVCVDENSFWADEDTRVVREEPETARVYGLKEQTPRFGEAVKDFAKKRPNEDLAHSSFVIPRHSSFGFRHWRYSSFACRAVAQRRSQELRHSTPYHDAATPAHSSLHLPVTI